MVKTFKKNLVRPLAFVYYTSVLEIHNRKKGRKFHKKDQEKQYYCIPCAGPNYKRISWNVDSFYAHQNDTKTWFHLNFVCVCMLKFLCVRTFTRWKRYLTETAVQEFREWDTHDVIHIHLLFMDIAWFVAS